MFTQGAEESCVCESLCIHRMLKKDTLGFTQDAEERHFSVYTGF